MMSRILVSLALVLSAFPVAAQTTGEAPSATTANYKDLTQSPGIYVAKTQAEQRAKTIASLIAANAISFKIALSMPDDPGQRQGFTDDLQGSTASPGDVQAYLDQVNVVFGQALDLVNKGSTQATDAQVAALEAATKKMRTLEIKVSNDNPQPDASQLSLEDLKPVADTKAKHVISDLVKLGNSGAVGLNDVPPDQLKIARDDLQRSRVHDLVVQSKESDPARKGELSRKLAPLVDQEINGALWQYREVVTLIVGGLNHPEQTAIDVFNTVLDEMKQVLIQERKLF